MSFWRVISEAQSLRTEFFAPHRSALSFDEAQPSTKSDEAQGQTAPET